MKAIRETNDTSDTNDTRDTKYFGSNKNIKVFQRYQGYNEK